MSELVQVKKQVTFEQLCPDWAKTIKQCGYIPISISSGIYQYKYCIVGEAHGWSKDYKCDSCMTFADRFACTSLRASHDFLIDKFVEHFNECHVTFTGPCDL